MFVSNINGMGQILDNAQEYMKGWLYKNILEELQMLTKEERKFVENNKEY